jgi:hypothetical protein
VNTKSSRHERGSLKTAEDIRKAFTARYPDVHDDEFNLRHSGFAQEHPMTAIRVVLVSSIVLGTTDVIKLVEFTRYSEQFVHSIAVNMENSRLWKAGKYDSSSRKSLTWERTRGQLWEHIYDRGGFPVDVRC